MKRVVLNRKNSLFCRQPHVGGRTFATLASLTSTCRRHQIDPQLYLTQTADETLPQTKLSELDAWLPDQWKLRQTVRTRGFEPRSLPGSVKLAFRMPPAVFLLRPSHGATLLHSRHATQDVVRSSLTFL